MGGAQKQLKSATGAESCAQNGFLQGCCFGAMFGGQAPVNGGGPLGADLGGRAVAKIGYRPRRLLVAFGALRGITAAAWGHFSGQILEDKLQSAVAIRWVPIWGAKLTQ